MKNFVWLAFLLAALSLGRARAQERGTGLGIIVGEPTGISLKSWLGKSTAFDAALAWSFDGNDFIQVHGDYLTHNFTLLTVEKGRLPFYYGIGGHIKFFNTEGKKSDDTRTRLGVRIPLGLAYLFEKTTLDIFVEVAPVLNLVPETEFELGAALGIRYFFSR
jgi:hypothetical protein